MPRSVQTLLIGLSILGLATTVFAQAADVDCTKCVDTRDIAYQAVTSGKIGKQAVTSGKIANEAVNTAKIRDAAVTRSKLSSGISNQIDANSAAAQRVDALELENAVLDDRVALVEFDLSSTTEELQAARDMGSRGVSSGEDALRILEGLISTLGLTCDEANYGKFYGCTQIAAGDGTVWDIQDVWHELSLALVRVDNVASVPGVPSPNVFMAQTNLGQVGDMIIAGTANLSRWTHRDADDVDRLVDDCDQPTIAMSPPSLGGTNGTWRVNNGGYYYTPFNTSTGRQDSLGENDVAGQMVGIVRNINPFGVNPNNVEWCVMSDQVTGVYNMYELKPYPFDLNEARFSRPLTPQ